jgi:peptidyl-prolyl cis-trans isomerase B (cyclophilin B)
VSSSKDRQRSAARLTREMAAKADEKAQQRRRKTIITGSTIGGVVVIVLVIVLIASLGGGKGSASASPSASAIPVSCTWTVANPSASASGSAAPSDSAGSVASAAPSTSASASPSINSHLKNVGTPPTTGLTNTGTQTMTISTNLGPITVTIDDSKTPCAAASFTYLASKKFFDNTSCFQMHNSGYFVIQCGDPSATGRGGPNYTYAPENVPVGNRPTYQAGVVALGTPPTVSGSNGSQFFIVYKDTQDDPSSDPANPTSVLPGEFTVLGTVSSGMDIVQKVAAGGLIPSKSDANTGKPKTALNINTLTVSAPAA